MSAFALPDRLSAKADPALIAADDARFTAIAEALHEEIAAASARRDAVRHEPAGTGQAALDRDLEVHRLTSRLGVLRRFGLDLCLGRMVGAEDSEPVYIGRLGLTDATGRRLLVDWRSPAAEPFFGATHANPMGLVSRRRYRWTAGRITDYWDEVFTAEGLENNAALDDQSAFIASLARSRSSRMHDVLATIQADQDAIIRADARGALVVDGGPGTGKTVVALHRTAYLLYADPRLGRGHGGVLFVGPHEPYLAYVDDVLPRLGEDGVRICTLRDLVPEGRTARAESDPDAARLKASATLLGAIETAVGLYERPPVEALTVHTPWIDLRLTPADWAEAFTSAEPGATHNEAREQVWQTVLEILVDAADGSVPAGMLRRALAHDDELTDAFARAWPVLDPTELVAQLWSSPGFLRRCAPWLTDADVRALQREERRGDGPRGWTASDLPFLDAARRRVGDPDAPALRRRRDALRAAEREERSHVIDHLIASDDSEMSVMSMLRGQDFQNTLDDDSALPTAEGDAFAGPFAHIVIDEAQELTDAEWQMLLQRCSSRSLTIVGDRAQARHGFSESWRKRLERVGLSRVEVATLTMNYRTPSEVMDEAAPVIRAVLPDANVPASLRFSGVPVRRGSVVELPGILEGWVSSHADGVACVIGDASFAGTPRVRSLTPETAKGLEFDLVVLVEPEAFGSGVEGAVDRYVAMTRATQQLVILSG